MKCKIRKVGSVTIFSVSGDMVLSCIDEIQESIRKELANSDTDKFLMNLSKMDNKGFASIGFIVSIYKSVLLRNGKYALVSQSEAVNSVLHTAGVTRHFKVYGSEEEAITEFNN